MRSDGICQNQRQLGTAADHIAKVILQCQLGWQKFPCHSDTIDLKFNHWEHFLSIPMLKMTVLTNKLAHQIETDLFTICTRF